GLRHGRAPAAAGPRTATARAASAGAAAAAATAVSHPRGVLLRLVPRELDGRRPPSPLSPERRPLPLGEAGHAARGDTRAGLCPDGCRDLVVAGPGEHPRHTPARPARRDRAPRRP